MPETNNHNSNRQEVAQYSAGDFWREFVLCLCAGLFLFFILLFFFALYGPEGEEKIEELTVNYNKGEKTFYYGEHKKIPCEIFKSGEAEENDNSCYDDSMESHIKFLVSKHYPSSSVSCVKKNNGNTPNTEPDTGRYVYEYECSILFFDYNEVVFSPAYSFFVISKLYVILVSIFGFFIAFFIALFIILLRTHPNRSYNDSNKNKNDDNTEPPSKNCCHQGDAIYSEKR